jgi:cellulose synthase/poly-beta-1,6-N-acetylglucosamine synthase-like glycosyltransferase
VEIALFLLAFALLILSLPAVIELGLFLFANIFLRSAPRRKGSDPAAAKIMKLAILVPAHDEATCIGRCVASILASGAGSYERDVVVIADNCHDRTAAIAAEAGALVVERFNDEVRGKGAALLYAISRLQGVGYDAFVIVDADSIVSKNFVKAMGDSFASGMEAAQCVYLALNVDAAPKVRLMNLSLLSMNVLRPMGRELLGFSAGIMGNGFGLSRALLERVPYTANSITEDLEYHLKLIESGVRVRFVPEARVLADFPLSKEGAATQRARWEGGRFRLQRTFAIPMLARILAGRAAMIEPFLELTSLPLAYESFLLLLLILLPGQPFHFYGIAGLTLVFAQTIAAVLLYGTRKDFLAFLEIPKYLLWKLISLPRILLASRKGASWVRTKRD